MITELPRETITLTVGKAEALILSELLADFHSEPILEFKDNAERLALVRLHGALESTLVEPFDKDYEELARAARKQLLSEWGTP
jgi:hypothetical protein